MSNKKRFGSAPSAGPKKGIQVQEKTAKKIGLFASVAILFNCICGTGIFFKNRSIFVNNHGNAVGVLVTWLLLTFIAFATAYSYIEISKVKTKVDDSGISGYYERYVGNRSSRFIKLIYPLFYWGIFVVVMSVFASEALLNIFPQVWVTDSSGNKLPGTIGGFSFAIVLLIGLAMSIFFLTLNFISKMVLPTISQKLSYVKFFALSFITIGAIVLFAKHPDYNIITNIDNSPDESLNSLSGQFNFSSVLTSAPAVLFSYDGFLVIGLLKSDVKNPDKTIPLSMILGMLLAGFVFIFITVCQLLCGCASPYLIFDKLIPNNNVLRNVFIEIISILIFVSLFSSLNSQVLGQTRSCQAAIDEEIIFGYRWFKRISNGRRSDLFGGTVCSLMSTIFWFILTGVPAIIINSDQIIDGFGNLVVLAIFVIYGVLPFFTLPRWCKVPTNEAKHERLQPITAVIGGVGCIGVPLYVGVGQFIINIIHDPFGPNTEWGLWYSGNVMTNLQGCIIFWITFVLLFALPLTNDLLLRHYDREYKQPFVWQKGDPKHFDVRFNG